MKGEVALKTPFLVREEGGRGRGIIPKQIGMDCRSEEIGHKYMISLYPYKTLLA